MYDNQVTRSQFGQTNARDTETFSDLPVQDESKLHIYLEDFDYYSGPVTATTTNGYSLTGVGATAALAAFDGGALNLIAATTAFIAALQRTQGSYKLAAGFRTWYESLAQLSTLANATQLILGLTNVTTTPFTAITDGVWFSSDAVGAGALSINVAVGSVVTTTALGANVVAAALGTYKWYWDGGVYPAAPNGRILWEASGPGVSANVRGVVAAPANFPGATLLAPQWAVKGTAATPTLLLDITQVAKDRTNINATPAF
jgi:hypothetical protein